MKSFLTASAAVLAVVVPVAAQACSGCGCTLDTDENTVSAGWSLDERVDFADQSKLRQGGQRATGDLGNPVGGDQHEVQRDTSTLFYTTTIDYQADGAWGVNVAVPFQYRTHSTYNTQSWTPSKSDWNELGDVRVLGRYGLTEGNWLNALVGFKAPTGSTQQPFNSGPSAGTQVDRGLQPGTGTWDLLLGTSQKGSLTNDLGWFAQELWQKPLWLNNGFAEGPKVTVSAGVRYQLTQSVMPQFQFNAQKRWHDQGTNADIPNSGGQVIYASPGLMVNVLENTTAYGFVQIPVYQRVGGVELTPAYLASVGLKYKF